MDLLRERISIYQFLKLENQSAANESLDRLRPRGKKIRKKARHVPLRYFAIRVSLVRSPSGLLHGGTALCSVAFDRAKPCPQSGAKAVSENCSLVYGLTKTSFGY